MIPRDENRANLSRWVPRPSRNVGLHQIDVSMADCQWRETVLLPSRLGILPPGTQKYHLLITPDILAVIPAAGLKNRRSKLLTVLRKDDSFPPSTGSITRPVGIDYAEAAEVEACSVRKVRGIVARSNSNELLST
jgi:hypothetical protein